MTFDPHKNASRIQIKVATARNAGYSGLDLLRLAELMRTRPDATEQELADLLDVDAGYNTSGVGDMKRLIISILRIYSKDSGRTH